MRSFALLLGLMGLALFSRPVSAQLSDERIGWEADIFRLPPRFNVRGLARILDDRTVELSHFYFDGGVPLVFGHLGTNNTDEAFLQGPRIGLELTRGYTNETLILQLPEGQTLNGYGAISIFCEPAPQNLGSALFVPPVQPSLTISRASGPYVSVEVSGPLRRVYWLQACQDPQGLAEWKTVLQVTNSSGRFLYYDIKTNQALFYRAVRE